MEAEKSRFSFKCSNDTIAALKTASGSGNLYEGTYHFSSALSLQNVQIKGIGIMGFHIIISHLWESIKIDLKSVRECVAKSVVPWGPL
jgi:hypothetical protein